MRRQPSSSLLLFGMQAAKINKRIDDDRKFLFNVNSIHNFARVRGTNFPHEFIKTFQWRHSCQNGSTKQQHKIPKLYIQEETVERRITNPEKLLPVLSHITHKKIFSFTFLEGFCVHELTTLH